QSCDCVTQINGYVIDANTKEPISNVSVSLVTNNYTRDDFGVITDSLSVTERQKIIAENGNAEKWEQTGTDNMIRRVSLKTDSSGFFNVFWHTGFCPEYELKLEKEGYKILTIDGEEISRDTITFELKIH
ncbi:MAG: hypothetical protein ACPGU4_00130, partial [Flavobacteriales bacterium]